MLWSDEAKMNCIVGKNQKSMWGTKTRHPSPTTFLKSITPKGGQHYLYLTSCWDCRHNYHSSCELRMTCSNSPTNPSCCSTAIRLPKGQRRKSLPSPQNTLTGIHGTTLVLELCHFSQSRAKPERVRRSKWLIKGKWGFALAVLSREGELQTADKDIIILRLNVQVFVFIAFQRKFSENRVCLWLQEGKK